jgi:hypothetical protein
MKVCCKCKVEKNLCEFANRSSAKDGKRSYCRKCESERGKEYDIKNREKELSRKKEYKIKNREKVLSRNKEYKIKNREKIMKKIED